MRLSMYSTLMMIECLINSDAADSAQKVEVGNMGPGSAGKRQPDKAESPVEDGEPWSGEWMTAAKMHAARVGSLTGYQIWCPLLNLDDVS